MGRTGWWSCLHVLVLSADKVAEQFSFVGEVDRADGARDVASGGVQRAGGGVQLGLVTHQSLARRETLHADRTHERRVRRLQNKAQSWTVDFAPRRQPLHEGLVESWRARQLLGQDSH